ncbi:sugar phosphate isomerase/epimerase [Imperialibacter roseus]|uniref:Sugar phosphate isomerase/epimerase n=1 Tax=Imperialibacter roseus TaxID=1324217 RepID=A0ABZ0IRP3_9BACT|nr:sugar phosphate isomerase/epimerase [Imperialibacter roseus]WOK06262.1 sugar phosphate isomerase/epimerase [Imperialibacter roseus]
MNRTITRISKRTIFLLVLALLAGAPAIMAQEIGIQMGSMRELMKVDVEKTLARLKELGVKELEGGTPRGIDKEAYKKLLEKYGLKVVAVGSNFDALQKPDELQAIIDNAKFYNAKFVLCYWIPHTEEKMTLEEMKKGVEVFNAAGKTLKENGLTFAYHAHGYEFVDYEGGNGTLYEYFMDNTNPDYVTVQMDVFWMRNPGQNPAALLRKYPTRFTSLHLKDRKPGSKDNLQGRQDPETNVVLGQGDVGIAEAMEAAMEIGIKHYFIEDESSRALEQVPQSLDYLASLKTKKGKKKK